METLTIKWKNVSYPEEAGGMQHPRSNWAVAKGKIQLREQNLEPKEPVSGQGFEMGFQLREGNWILFFFFKDKPRENSLVLSSKDNAGIAQYKERTSQYYSISNSNNE